jgi:hypothetical protein
MNYAGLTKCLKFRSTLYDVTQTGGGGAGGHRANKACVCHNPRKSINTEAGAPRQDAKYNIAILA